MKTQFTLFASLLALLVLAPAQSNGQESNLAKLELYKVIRRCTVKVAAKIDDKSAKLGTGVCVMRAGHSSEYAVVITNAHVVTHRSETRAQNEVATVVRVKPWQKNKETWLDGYVMFHHMDDNLWFDLSFLIIKDPDQLIETAIVAKKRDFKVGSQVYACGNPQDEEFLVDDGELMRFDPPKTDLGQLMAHNALIEHGSSGGGLFNARGELIGINTWMIDGKFGIAQDAQWFLDFFQFGWGSASATANNWQPLHNCDGGVDPNPLKLETGQSLKLAGLGKWQCRPDEDEVNAGGFSEYVDGRVIRDHYFGCLLARVGETVGAVVTGHKGTDGSIVAYDEERNSALIRAAGEAAVRINDNNVADNEGRLTVVYFVMGRPEWYIGVETAAPSEEEHEKWKLYDVDEKGVKSSYGAKVTKVHPFSDAAHGGIQEGDFIVSVDCMANLGSAYSVNEKTLNTVIEKLRTEEGTKGARIIVTYRRDGKDKEVLIGFDGK